jgi:lactoylglutathione lyase
MRVNYAIVFVSEMKRSVAFYRDILGLPLKFESPGWTEFSTEGAILALHFSEMANPPKGNSGPAPAGMCRPGLGVPNIDKFHQRTLRSTSSAFRSRRRYLVLASLSTQILTD